MVEECVSALIECVVHLLVLLPIHVAAKLGQVFYTPGFLGILVNETLVHANETLCHCRIRLEGLIWIVGSSHEIAFSKVLCEQCASNVGKLVLWHTLLAVEEQGAEQKLHVKVGLQALHILSDFEEILSLEALESTLSVIDPLQHWQKPDPDIVAQDDLHHVGLLIVALGMWGCTIVRWLHEESSRSPIASTSTDAASRTLR